MNVLYVGPGEFDSETSARVLSLASAIQARGFGCAVTAREGKVRGRWPFPICTHAETMRNGVLFADGRGPDLIHAWTPREPVRRVTERSGCPYIVQVEEDEDAILADALKGFDYAEFKKLPTRVMDEAIPAELAHPKRYRWFLEGAAAVTKLADVDALARLYEEAINGPARVTRSEEQEPLPVAIEKVPAERKFWRKPYLEAAARAVAEGGLRVEQREGGDPHLYERWLAAAVERAMSLRAASVEVTGWREQAEWKAATLRGYAQGMGNHLRGAGLRISDVALERALGPYFGQEEAETKTEERRAAVSLDGIAGLRDIPTIGYATVRDYCESMALHADAMRNVQMNWMAKAISGQVAPGGLLLQIGGGMPRPAGYDPWVIDANRFSDELPCLPAGVFDCVYSVAVLDQLGESELRAAARGMAKFLKPDGVALHTMEHVRRGMGEEADLKRLELSTELFGIEDVELRATLQRMDRDLDTFTLSAEGLNRRRGSLPYDQFRMRRCVSLQFRISARNLAHNLGAADRP